MPSGGTAILRQRLFGARLRRTLAVLERAGVEDSMGQSSGGVPERVCGFEQGGAAYSSGNASAKSLPPIRMSLKQALESIEDDELVEVTPKAIRLGKKHLTEIERKKASRQAA